MIPYDDLVAALQSWRARQGLPVGAGAIITAPAVPAAIASTPGPGLGVNPGSGPRNAPPTPPRTNPPAARTPMPLAAPEDSLDVDESHLLDEQVYEPEGDDFALAFGKNDSSEATQIGDGPAAEATDPAGLTGGKHEREDW